jgi:chemosensory pili system protein ChpA (sensor histidine kinase/response regulator)
MQMSPSESAQQASSLNWVKEEIHKSLNEARADLEAYVEDTGQKDKLERCAELIQQVRGTLQMVQLHGAVVLNEEMEQLTQAILKEDDAIPDLEVAYEALMRAIIQLPDYLERIQAGQRDAAVVLLPLINDLRTARGQNAVAESALFTPEFTGIVPDASEEEKGDQDLSGVAKKIRHQVHLSMLGWFRKKDPENALKKLISLLDQQRMAAKAEPVIQMYWVAAALAEALHDGGLESDAPVNPILGQVDRQTKEIIDSGEEAVAADPPTELIRILLYYVACATSEGERVQQIKEAFRLSEFLPSEDELARLRAGLSGPNIEVMETVIVGIRQELDRARDMLDLYNRTGGGDTDKLETMVQAMKNAAGTIAMVGRDDIQAAVNERCSKIEALLAGQSDSQDAGLMDLAGFIIETDNELKNILERRSGKPEGDSAESGSSYWDVMTAVVRESSVNMSTAKDAIVSFVASPEERPQLEKAAMMLQQIAGSLKIASLDRASEIVHAIRDYIEKELIEKAITPEKNNMESFAEAVSSIEYYLEAVIEDSPNKESALDMAEAAMDLLGYLPGTASAIDEAAEQSLDAEEADTDVYELEDDVEKLETITDDLAKYTHVEREPEDVIELSPEDLEEEELPEVSLEEAVSDIEEQTADVEEIEVEAPVESEEDMAERLAAEREDEGEDVLPEGGFEVEEQITEEAADLEEIEVEAPVETEEEIAARIAAEREELEVEELSTIEHVEETDLGVEEVQIDVAGEAEAVEATEEEAPAEPRAQPAAMEESPLGDDLDEEIVDIFIEEAQEVLEELGQQFPQWQKDVTNADALATVRRNFHTLKGSGRMVGANLIGEFSWSMENMLNRVIDGTVKADDNVLAIIAKAIEILPPMVEQLTGGAGASFNVMALANMADTVSEGKPIPEGGVESLGESDTSAGVEPAESNVSTATEESATPEEVSTQVEITPSSPLQSDELREIFTAEARKHLALLHEFIAECQSNPDECLLDSPQIRAVHTLRGSTATVGALELSKLFEITEPMALFFQENSMTCNHDEVDLLDRVILRVEAFVDYINGGEKPPDNVKSLCDELEDAFDQAMDRYVEPVVEEAIQAESESPEEGPAALEEIESSLEDLHELMSTEQVAVDLVEPREVEAPPAIPPATDELQASDDAVQAEEMAAAEALLAQEPSAEDAAFKPWPEQAEPTPVPVEEEIQAEPVVDEEDDEMLEIFMEEAAELLDSTEATLADWQQDEGNQDLVVNMQRDLHTIKGGARMVNLTSFADLSHAMETLLTAVVDGQVVIDSRLFDGLNTARDALHDMFESIQSGHRGVQADQNVISLMEAIRKNEQFEEPSISQPVSAEAPEQAQVEAVEEAELESKKDKKKKKKKDKEKEAAEIAAAPQPEAAPEAEEEIERDPELLEIFMDEAKELLDSTEGTLNDWQNDQDNTELLVNLQRDLHTLKGGARMVNLSEIGDLGHEMETLLTSVVDGHTEISDALFDVLHASRDSLQDMYEMIVQGNFSMTQNNELLNRLELVRKGIYPDERSDSFQVQAYEQEASGVTPAIMEDEVTPSGALPSFKDEYTPSEALQALDEKTPSGALPSIKEEEDVTPSGALPSIQHDDEEITPSGALPSIKKQEEFTPSQAMPAIKDKAAEAEAAKDRRHGGRVEHETIRVRADLIDGLVNLAGESNIYRSRLEQQGSSFGFSINELDQTVTRLRNQLRNLEMETEAQILFRHEKEMDNPEHEDFDPLEMDRYSTLQQLARSLVESVGDLASLREILEEMAGETEMLLVQQGRVNTELQDRLMQARVVPFAATLAPRMRRIIRQTSQQLGKKAELRLFGANEEIDRNVLDRMTAPLEHMLRNAVAHGIEPPEERASKGKPPGGTIAVSVKREGGEILIEVADDGRGLDTNAIRKKGIERGLITEDAELIDSDLMQLILQPGFSTAEKVSQIAGRGVGMDVVHNEIKQLGGSFEIDSVFGRGTSLTVRLPFTLAISQALLVNAGNELFSIPLNAIEGVSRITQEDFEKLFGGENPENFRYGNEDYQVVRMTDVLGYAPILRETEERPALIMVRSAGHNIAFYVDGLLGNYEIVVKSLGAQISTVNGLSGGTILGDGRVALILDIPALVRMVVGEQIRTHIEAAPVEIEAVEKKGITVMVVDDSLTVRKVTTRLLERQDMEVVTAKDGVDAVTVLEETIPDVMLLDVEMPRMDGFELATQMRNDERYRNVPIIMITSRTGEKHRQRALDIGVNRYMGKPYQESELLDNIKTLVQEQRSGIQQPAAVEEPQRTMPLVMVVDDSLTVRRVTSKLLERHKMDVVTAQDGVDAVSKLEDSVPDIMLLDIEMPRMDGFELATQMRNDDRYKDVPIIMITSRTGEKHRKRAEEIGVNRYLGKPYQEADLMSNINELLDTRGA